MWSEVESYQLVYLYCGSGKNSLYTFDSFSCVFSSPETRHMRVNIVVYRYSLSISRAG